MATVITYGTFDCLHKGHIKLLERAKKLGDFLIVGVTSDSFDKERGKINVKQSLSERMSAVERTGLANKIIVEEYEGQKIDDIKRYGVDIFTVGSDWVGKFDYLKQYCKVVYLERTKGISSSDIRASESTIRIGIVGSEEKLATKFAREASFVNGVVISGSISSKKDSKKIDGIISFDKYQDLLNESDAVYIVSRPQEHFSEIKLALKSHKHVLCESPLVMKTNEWDELKGIAKKSGLVLMDAVKTAYAPAYYKLLLTAQEKIIGDVLSVDSTSTSLENGYSSDTFENEWPGFCFWGAVNMLPVFQLLGCNYSHCSFVTRPLNSTSKLDLFTKINITFDHSTATIKEGVGVKSEGELIVSGTKGYIYVPAPWWKTDYFEIRFENPANNKKVFYQLDGEGIRYEVLSFVKTIFGNKGFIHINDDVSRMIVQTIQDFYSGNNVTII